MRRVTLLVVVAAISVVMLGVSASWALADHGQPHEEKGCGGLQKAMQQGVNFQDPGGPVIGAPPVITPPGLCSSQATSCSRGAFTGSETREGGSAVETTAGPGITAGRASSGPTGPSEALRKLRVEQPGSMSGYSRASFPHWSDAQENGWEGRP